MGKDDGASTACKQIPYAKIASWPFGDFIFNSGFDNISSTIKARRAGFHACIDTEEMFETQFQRLRRPDHPTTRLTKLQAAKTVAWGNPAAKLGSGIG